MRTPIGRYGGALASVRPDDLAAAVDARDRRAHAASPPRSIDDVYFGAANQSGEDNRNVARMAVLLADLPVEVPGATVNRLCGSSLQAINSAAQAIAFGEGDVMIAGGVESMTRAPYVLPRAMRRSARKQAALRYGARLAHDQSEDAEGVDDFARRDRREGRATQYGISREEQDRFAFESQMKCKAAMRARRVSTTEIVPLSVGDSSRATNIRGRRRRSRRWRSSSRRLQRDGTVTAGNSSGINDGAAALLLVRSADGARAWA